MRLIQRSFGLIFGGSFAIASGLAGAACSGDDFNGCAAARNCASSAGASGSPNAGHGGESEAGKAGQGGASGFAGKANGGKAALGDESDAGSPDDDAGAGNAPEPGGSGGARNDPMPGGGTGGRETTRPPATGGSANGSEDAPAGMGGEAPEARGDTEAPHISMVTTQSSATAWPDTGAKGVKADDVIVVVFDEPMDASTAGYASSDLPPDDVQFTWDDTKTRLSIKPSSPLKYAEVSDPATSGQQYVFIVGTGFHDLAGNALASPKTVVFTTLRHITHTLPVQVGGGAVITESANGTTTTSTRCESANDHVTVGEDAGRDPVFAVVMFSLSSLPDSIQWNSATLTGTLGVTQTNAFGSTRFGTLHAYTASAAPSKATWDSAETDLGPFSTHASQATGAVSVTNAVTSDYRDRARNVSEYMFRFERQTETDDVTGHDQYAYLSCDDLKLELDYFAP